MDEFSWGQAWSLGFILMKRRLLQQAILLIGVGIVLPLALQYSILGIAVGRMSPQALAQSETSSVAALGAMVIAVLVLSYILQIGSYFGSSRLALRPNESLGAALLFGLFAGVVVLIALGVLGFVTIWIGQAIALPGIALLVILALSIPLMALFGAIYTVPSALIAVGLSAMLVIAIVIGAITGEVGLAATMVGGSGSVTVMLLVMSAVLLWLAARLSCTTALMAEHGTLNIVSAMRESWRLTWDEQWSIMRYLALIGFGLTVLIFCMVAAIGYSSAGLMQAGGPTQHASTAFLALAGGVPVAFLAVMITAGIYRSLENSTSTAEVFT
jgi:hypothetical protein